MNIILVLLLAAATTLTGCTATDTISDVVTGTYGMAATPTPTPVPTPKPKLVLVTPEPLRTPTPAPTKGPTVVNIVRDVDDYAIGLWSNEYELCTEEELVSMTLANLIGLHFDSIADYNIISIDSKGQHLGDLGYLDYYMNVVQGVRCHFLDCGEATRTDILVGMTHSTPDEPFIVLVQLEDGKVGPLIVYGFNPNTNGGDYKVISPNGKLALVPFYDMSDMAYIEQGDNILKLSLEW